MFLDIFALILLFFTVAGYFRSIWWFSLLDFFRLQYSFIACILIAVSLVYADAAGVFTGAIILGLNIYRMHKFLPNPTARNAAGQKTFLSVNAYKDNHSPDQLKKLIDEVAPQTLLIMEMTDELEDVLSEILADYPHKLESPVRDGFKIVLLSKNVLENAHVSFHGPHDTPLLKAEAEIEGQRVQIYSAHPKPALNKQWYEERHAYFAEIEDVIQGGELPIVIMGDFNSVPWETHFSKFLNNTGLKSTLEGYGYKVTWPVYLPFFGVPMDHILVSKSLRYSSLRVGPYVGSDHFPISLNI